MAVLAVMSPVFKDSRMTSAGGSETFAPTVNSSMKSGYEWLDTTSGNVGSRLLFNKTLSSAGDKLWIWFEYRAGAYTGWGASDTYDFMQLGVSGVTDPRVLLQQKAADGKMSVFVSDNNGGASTPISGITGFTDASRHTYCVEVHWKSTTELEVALYIDGTQQARASHNNAGGLGTIAYKRAFCSGNTAPPKGATHAGAGGEAYAHDNTGTDPVAAAMPTDTSRIQRTTAGTSQETGSHPTTLPDENDFRNTADSGAAVVTEVDDVWGTAVGTRDDDFNQSTLTTSPKTIAYGFPFTDIVDLALGRIIAVIFGGDIEVVAGQFLNAGEVTLIFEDETGATLSVDAFVNDQGDVNRSFWFGVFNKMPDGRVINEYRLVASNFKVKKETTGATHNIKIHTADLLIYYEPSQGVQPYIKRTHGVPGMARGQSVVNRSGG